MSLPLPSVIWLRKSVYLMSVKITLFTFGRKITTSNSILQINSYVVQHIFSPCLVKFQTCRSGLG